MNTDQIERQREEDYKSLLEEIGKFDKILSSYEIEQELQTIKDELKCK